DHRQSGCPLNLPRAGAQFQFKFSQARLRPHRLEEMADYFLFLRPSDQNSIVGCAYYKTVSFGAARNNEFKDVAAAITDPHPTRPLVCRRRAEPHRGSFPEIRFEFLLPPLAFTPPILSSGGA